MFYDRDLIGSKLRRWENYLNDFTLPTWEELPNLPLYMDQVIYLMAQYLNFLPADEHGNPAVTASTVNNYVRLKIMPPPAKKRYARIHLAYLIMICTLKQSLSISYVQKMIPIDIPEETVRDIYNSYVRRHKSACLYFLQNVHDNAHGILSGDKDATADSIENLIFTFAIISGFSKLLAEKIVRLQNMREEDVPKDISALLLPGTPPEK